MSNLIYVSNVNHSSEMTALEDLFLTVGDIKTQRVEVIPESGHRLAFGIFEMSTMQQALDCVERFNGATNEGRQLSVTFNRPKRRAVLATPKGKLKRAR